MPPIDKQESLDELCVLITNQKMVSRESAWCRAKGECDEQANIAEFEAGRAIIEFFNQLPEHQEQDSVKIGNSEIILLATKGE